MCDTLVVNLLGEPSAGKSTAATYIFAKLKLLGISCEYVSEYAKDKVYEHCDFVFEHQEYIFGKQAYKMARVNGKVDVIVTDSPLILSAVYNTNAVLGENFNKVVVDVFNTYKNYNVFLTRHHKYENEGRIHNEEEAQNIRKELMSALDKYKVEYSTIPSSKDDYDRIVDDVVAIVGKRK